MTERTSGGAIHVIDAGAAVWSDLHALRCSLEKYSDQRSHRAVAVCHDELARRRVRMAGLIDDDVIGRRIEIVRAIKRRDFRGVGTIIDWSSHDTLSCAAGHAAIIRADLPAPIDAALMSSIDRESGRRALGAGESDRVVALLDEAPDRETQLDFLAIIAALRLAEAPVVGVMIMPDRLDEALSDIIATIDAEARVTTIDAPPWELLPLTDICLLRGSLTPRRRSNDWPRWAAGAGRPIVADRAGAAMVDSAADTASDDQRFCVARTLLRAVDQPPAAATASAHPGELEAWLEGMHKEIDRASAA